MNKESADHFIAVVGLSCRVSDLKTPEEFWQALVEGRDLVSRFTREELLEARVDPASIDSPRYVPAKPQLSDIDLFDAPFFSINASEAQLLDPQHRVFLECGWEAVESAGHIPSAFPGTVGVFASTNMSSYLLRNLSNNPDAFRMGGDFQAVVTNDKDYLASRLAYHLGLTGPSITVQTACSGSLVAIIQACESLLSGACDMALAGGVSILLPANNGYLHSDGGLFSPDGLVRAYDAKAAGTVFGDGIGVVVLRRLEDALREGDRIHAVIRGWSINNDGNMRSGFTAPGIRGQSEVIADAQAMAEISVESIRYVEGHGSGTPLGDTMEVEALTRAFRLGTTAFQFCALGSVKSNAGHTYSAAGALGFIKTVLALEHRVIPPSIHFEEPNPQINFARTPFYVPQQAIEWNSGDSRRRAGVSSFGLGGTNAHVVIEEAPEQENESRAARPEVMLLSARSHSALERATENLVGYLETHEESSLADVAHTLQVGRARFPHRRAIICNTIPNAISRLRALDPADLLEKVDFQRSPEVVFMFPGVGDHYVNMGRELYDCEEVFRAEFDQCCALLQEHISLDLREIVYPRTGSKVVTAGSSQDLRRLIQKRPSANGPRSSLDRALFAQPAVFAIDYALAKLWMSWGVAPVAMIGHSIGEFVAACLSGVLSLEDALMVVAKRASLMEGLPKGAMLAVLQNEEHVRRILPRTLSIAAANSPSLCVVSGPPEAIAEFEDSLLRQGELCRHLPVTRAYHSEMVKAVRSELEALFQKVNLRPPQIPYISNVTGTWATSEESVSPEFWSSHSYRTVSFCPGVQRLAKGGRKAFLEVGPGTSLTGFTLQSIGADGSARQEHAAVPSLPPACDDAPPLPFMLRTFARLWLEGADIEWEKYRSTRAARRISLPTYPFERQRYWIEPTTSSQPAASGLHRRELAEWFTVPIWKQSSVLPLPTAADAVIPEQRRIALAFVDDSKFASTLAAQIEAAGTHVVIVREGTQFQRVVPDQYEIRPNQPEDYEQLVQDINASGRSIDAIFHAWLVWSFREGTQALDSAMRQGFSALVPLANALSAGIPDGDVRLFVLTDGMREVMGGDGRYPEKALILGLCRVLHDEYPNIRCRAIDLPIVSPEEIATSVAAVISEAAVPDATVHVAYRGGRRWVEEFSPVKLAGNSRAQFREGGVYLITGGLGGLGLAVAECVSSQVKSKFVLLSRSEFPERNDWSTWVEKHPDDRITVERIGRIQSIETTGSKVRVLSADIADEASLSVAIAESEAQFGTINGVFHAAGVPASKFLQLRTCDEAAAVLRPKVIGTLALENCLDQHQLDFFVLFSSELAVFPTIGQGDYAAANCFMDVFAARRRSLRGDNTISINWSAWKWDAWQKSYFQTASEIQTAVNQFRATYGIDNAEGGEAIQRALATPFPQVAVSVLEFGAAPTFMRSLETTGLVTQTSNSVARHPRPQLATAYVGPRNPAEEQLCELWALALSLEKVGIYDNFLELGGNSLIATQIISRIRDQSHRSISIRNFLNCSTIAELSKLLTPSHVSGEPQEMAVSVLN